MNQPSLKQTGNRLDLTVDDIHEVVLIRYSCGGECK